MIAQQLFVTLAMAVVADCPNVDRAAQRVIAAYRQSIVTDTGAADLATAGKDMAAGIADCPTASWAATIPPPRGRYAGVVLALRHQAAKKLTVGVVASKAQRASVMSGLQSLPPARKPSEEE